MTDFMKVYKSTIRKKRGIDQSVLYPLLQRVHHEATRIPTDRSGLKEALFALLRFLETESGKSEKYYYAVDDFFSDYKDKWIPQTGHLTEDFRTIFNEMCFLHGAVEQPEYHATPEEIMMLVDEIQVDNKQE